MRKPRLIPHFESFALYLFISLHNVAQKYREMKRYNAKITPWGQSLGIRIPKALVARYHFKANEEVSIIPEKEGIRIVSSK